MSVVVGLKHKDKCWLACDRQVTLSDSKAFLETQNKVFDVPGRTGCIMGHVGLLRGINLLETNNNYIDELAYYKKQLDYSYMVNYFPLAVQSLFVDNGLLFTEDDKSNFTLKGDFIVVTPEGDMFEIGWDGSVMEKNSFSAIGSGKEYALGSLCTSELTDESTDEDVMKVLQNAILSANLNLYCGGGGIIMNNKDKEIYEF